MKIESNRSIPFFQEFFLNNKKVLSMYSKSQNKHKSKSIASKSSESTGSYKISVGENENIYIKSSKANRSVLSLSRVADNGSINERTMMDGFVDYVSINKRARSTMYRMGCTKFTFEERLINVVCVSYIHSG